MDQGCNTIFAIAVCSVAAFLIGASDCLQIKGGKWGVGAGIFFIYGLFALSLSSPRHWSGWTAIILGVICLICIVLEEKYQSWRYKRAWDEMDADIRHRVRSLQERASKVNGNLMYDNWMCEFTINLPWEVKCTYSLDQLDLAEEFMAAAEPRVKARLE